MAGRDDGVVAHVWRILRGGRLTPKRAALSVALGLFVGVTPLYGLHFFLVVGVGLWLRLDVPLAYMAANISVPPMAPLLALVEIQLGALLRTGALSRISRSDITAQGALTFAKDLWLGTALFAPAIAAFGGSVTYLVRRAFPSRGRTDERTLDAEALARTLARYDKESFANRAYVAIKLETDPVFRNLAAEGPLGRVIDIGAGRGQGALYLLERGAATRCMGLDWDEAKIAVAKRAAAANVDAAGLDASFRAEDVRKATLEEADTVLLVDVLHYLTRDEQSALLRLAARHAKDRVLVRDVDPDRGLRSRITLGLERLTTRRSWNRGERVLPRAIADLARDLEDEGFVVEGVRPCWGATPFSNVLLVARRKA